MTNEERAQQYVAIFLGAGDRWRDCVPVDGRVEGDVVHLGDVTLTDQRDGTWTIEAPGQARVRFRKAAA